jgi:hypothetical protein
MTDWDLKKKHSQQDYEDRLKNQKASEEGFKRVVNSIGRDAAIEAGLRKERAAGRDYRSNVSTQIMKFKSGIARALAECPFPPVVSRAFSPAPSVKEQLQSAFDGIDPYAADGEARLKQLLATVKAHRAAVDPLAARPFDFAAGPPKSGPTHAEKQKLTDALREVERQLEHLIMYAGWWRTA